MINNIKLLHFKNKHKNKTSKNINKYGIAR